MSHVLECDDNFTHISKCIRGYAGNTYMKIFV